MHEEGLPAYLARLFTPLFVVQCILVLMTICIRQRSIVINRLDRILQRSDSVAYDLQFTDVQVYAHGGVSMSSNHL